MKINWPERREYDSCDSAIARHHKDGYNVALDACIKSYEDAGQLRAMDEDKLYNLILLIYRQNGNSAGCLKAYTKAICQTFGVKQVTEEDIHDVIKSFLREYNIVWHIGKLQTAGAGKMLAKAIVEKLNATSQR